MTRIELLERARVAAGVGGHQRSVVANVGSGSHQGRRRGSVSHGLIRRKRSDRVTCATTVGRFVLKGGSVSETPSLATPEHTHCGATTARPSCLLGRAGASQPE